MKLDEIKKLADLRKNGSKILREQMDEKYQLLIESGYSTQEAYKVLAGDQVNWYTLMDWHYYGAEKRFSTLKKFFMLLEGHDDVKDILKSIIPLMRNNNYVPVTIDKRKLIRKKERDAEILNIWNNNLYSTLQSIGDAYAISRERVRQILYKLKARGFDVKESKIKTKQRNEKIKLSNIKDIEIGLKYYGTLHYFKWRDQFINHPSLHSIVRSQALREVLIKRWNEDLDPLFNFKISIELRPNHFKVLDYRKAGKTLEEITVILNISKPSVTNYLRELREHGLYHNVNEEQVRAVTLDKTELEKNLDHIRNELRQGKILSQIQLPDPHRYNQVRHYIRRHFLYPHFVDLRKQTEKSNKAIIRLA